PPDETHFSRLQISLRHPGQTDWPDLWENGIAIFAGCRPSARPGAMPIGKGRRSVLQHIDQIRDGP
ncbi:hypothetical protein, partial [Acidithiobacillus sp.]|uniref:hypothetical protein n=1 Tax=Acidithiobacillus sp. TaxID=1872118 RepID=UPI003D076D74